MIFSSFFSGTTFLLPLVFSVLVWILSKPRIRTLVWVRCSIQGFFFLCELICEVLLGLFSFSGTSFSPALILAEISVLFLQSLETKAPRYLKWSLCLSLMPLIVMLMSGGSSLRLITTTSVFLLFSSTLNKGLRLRGEISDLCESINHPVCVFRRIRQRGKKSDLYDSINRPVCVFRRIRQRGKKS